MSDLKCSVLNAAYNRYVCIDMDPEAIHMYVQQLSSSLTQALHLFASLSHQIVMRSQLCRLLAVCPENVNRRRRTRLIANRRLSLQGIEQLSAGIQARVRSEQEQSTVDMRGSLKSSPGVELIRGLPSTKCRSMGAIKAEQLEQARSASMAAFYFAGLPPSSRRPHSMSEKHLSTGFGTAYLNLFICSQIL